MNELNVEFHAEVPDDAVWNDGGDLVVPPGKVIAEYVSNALVAEGMRCTKVLQRDYYGWEFHIELAGADVIAVLQGLDERVIVLRCESSILWPSDSKSRVSALSATAESIKRALVADSRFTNVRILTEDESPS